VSVVIGCDSFLALRNVRNGDLGCRLIGESVAVWVDPHQVEGSRTVQPAKVEVGILEDFDARADPALNAMLVRSHLTRKCSRDPSTAWLKLRRSSHRQHRTRPFRRLISIGRAAAAFAGYWIAGQVGQAQRCRQRFIAALRGHAVARTYQRRLKAADAKVVAGFSPEGTREMALIEAANAVGIPTAVMIRSRDNLASKVPHLPEADAYLVWSEPTRAFLLHLYPEIPADRVHVVGSPQFDHHLDPAYRMSRTDFFAKMRLDPDRPLIVYTMATPGLADHEINIAQHLADAAHAGRFARRAQVLVRGHPRMFGSNLRLLYREYPEARSYPAPVAAPYQSPEHEAGVVRHIIEDEAVHLATVAHQDVQVNICGTMTIDSAILDKPVVNVYYDLGHTDSAGLSVRAFYQRTDVKHMMAYGASRLAYDPEHCIRLINAYLEDPTLDSQGRRRAREEDCGPLDGRAGARIATILATLVGQRTPHAAAV
jgi:hypothetical protein